MAQPLGPLDSAPTSGATSPARLLEQSKQKGCRQQKCSKWKGGKCRCGRD